MLADTNVTDEIILKQTNGTMSDENERRKCLGPATHQKPTNVHSVQAEANTAQSPSVKEKNGGKNPKIYAIQELTEKLTSLVELMQKSTEKQKSEQERYTWRVKMDGKREKPYGCENCVEWNLSGWKHCFY